MRTNARFPDVPEKAGHYESFYLKLCAPTGGRGAWIRHTVHKRPGAEPTASVWVTLFDAERGAPRATKITVGADRLSVPAGAYIEIADALLRPGEASGSVSTDALTVSWQLRFADRHEPFRHLPRPGMYEARIPRTKLLSPHPGASYSGWIEVDGERIDVDNWPGMVGHNWGAEHAERWVWIHGSAFAGRPDVEFFDLAAGRIKLAGLTIPWIANGALSLGGELYRLGGPGRVRSTRISETPTSCEFTIPGRDVVVRGRVSAPPEQFVGWVYADPDGPEHNTVNCSIADMELEVTRPGERAVELVVSGGAAYELGMRETDHGIPLQPYPDG